MRLHQPDPNRLLSGDALEAFLQKHERLAAEARLATENHAMSSLPTTPSAYIENILKRLRLCKETHNPTSTDEFIRAFDRQCAPLTLIEECTYLHREYQQLRDRYATPKALAVGLASIVLTGATLDANFRAYNPHTATCKRFDHPNDRK